MDLRDYDVGVLRSLLRQACVMKGRRGEEGWSDVLRGEVLALLFERPSTRTRISFEVGMRLLGGEVIVLQKEDMALGRGESIADTARVLSRYVDVVMLRTDYHSRLEELVRYAGIPVINGLTERSHPCQVLADVMTYEEYRGLIGGRVIAWCGDGNNVARSWIDAAVCFGFTLYLACPGGCMPDREVLEWSVREGGRVFVTEDIEEAVSGADCVVTDSWVSMSTTRTVEESRRLFRGYCVTREVMDLAKSDALFMHCLPAYRGQEVTSEVLEGECSVVWDEAENRLYVQQAILLWCLQKM